MTPLSPKDRVPSAEHKATANRWEWWFAWYPVKAGRWNRFGLNTPVWVWMRWIHRSYGWLEWKNRYVAYHIFPGERYPYSK